MLLAMRVGIFDNITVAFAGYSFISSKNLYNSLCRTFPEIRAQNAGNEVSGFSKIQNFPGDHAPGPP